jgi:hypothetical protein
MHYSPRVAASLFGLTYSRAEPAKIAVEDQSGIHKAWFLS